MKVQFLSLLWREAGLAEKAAMTLALLLALTAIVGPLVVPFDPASQSLLTRLRPPAGFERGLEGHLLGTDELGRDLLTRAIYGLQMTLGSGPIDLK